MKRWAASQRGIRWTLGGIAAVGLAPAAARVLFVPAGDRLAHHDVSSAGQPPLRTARDAARGRLLTAGAGLLATGGVLLTVRKFVLSRDGQVTDRYAKAIGQLGSEKLDVRIGGICALERVARDSARDHPAVMEMLAAFIREHSHEQWPPPDPGGRARERSLRPGVHAALTVVGRRLTERDIRPIDLARADLTGANLGGARLTGANLTCADLADADLADADLTRADLTRAELTGAGGQ
jgi:Pentapeptide repeats (8 copies)